MARYVRACDRALGERLIMQAHWTASLAIAGWNGKLKPLSAYIAPDGDETDDPAEEL